MHMRWVAQRQRWEPANWERPARLSGTITGIIPPQRYLFLQLNTNMPVATYSTNTQRKIIILISPVCNNHLNEKITRGDIYI